MKLLYFIIGILVVMVDICIFFTVLFTGLVCYHWLLNEIKVVYPDLYISDLFRVALFIGCMMICSWFIRKMDEKKTMKVKYNEKVTETEIQ
jgi:TRAP-type C4-dicarboxylate transport system permease small subunit